VNIWKVILVTLVIFSAGVITGSLATRRTLPSPEGETASNSQTNRPSQGFRPDRMMRRNFIERVGQELALTPEQTTQIEAVLRESQERTRQLWEEISPQMRAEFQATQEKIRELLTPEQQQQFEELMQKHRPPRREDRDRRQPGPDQPPREPPPPGAEVSPEP